MAIQFEVLLDKNLGQTPEGPSGELSSEIPEKTEASEIKLQQDQFLAAVASGMSVRGAAESAEIALEVPHDWLESDPAFAGRFRLAQNAGTDLIEEEAYRRAVTGVEKPVYRSGEVVGHIADYSDTMLMFLLKARRPELYGGVARAGTGKSDASATEQLNLKGVRSALISKFVAVTNEGETPNLSEQSE
jgi:hypothetical protein